MLLRRVLLIMLLSAGMTLAQASRPSAAPGPQGAWDATLRALAEALVNSSDRDAVAEVLAAGTAIRRFDRLDPEDRLSLHETTAGSAVVAVFGYRSIPTTIASDLASAMDEAEFIPQTVRDEFTLEGAKQTKESNETATQWVTTTLQPGVEQPVGLILLWQQRAPQNSAEQATGQLIFVLVKAQETAPDQFRMSQVIYGDTRQIIR